MINTVYLETYDTRNMSLYYRFNIFLYKKVKYLYKIFSLKSLMKLSGFNSFKKDNVNIDLLNNNGSIEYKDYNNKTSCDSLDELYNKSIDVALKRIDDINKYMNNRLV